MPIIFRSSPGIPQEVICLIITTSASSLLFSTRTKWTPSPGASGSSYRIALEKKNDVQWALTWLNRVKEQTGVKPMIYMSESVVNAYDWSPVVAADYGLWVAKYRDTIPDYNYDMSNAGNVPTVKWWKGYAMWQWTSTGKLDGYNGSLDCDIFYGNKQAWLAYARSSDKDVPEENTEIADLRSNIEALMVENKSLKETIEDYKMRIEKAKKALRGDL